MKAKSPTNAMEAFGEGPLDAGSSTLDVGRLGDEGRKGVRFTARMIEAAAEDGDGGPSPSRDALPVGLEGGRPLPPFGDGRRVDSDAAPVEGGRPALSLAEGPLPPGSGQARSGKGTRFHVDLPVE